jgi:hypothetical protein
MDRLSGRWGCLLAFSFVPGFLAAYFLHSRVWLFATPAVLVILMLVVARSP